MLSYCIATNKEPEILIPTFQSIEALAPHDYEIVICSPYPKPDWVKDPKITYVLDTINDGSTHGMNLAAKQAKGEWIIIGTDEHTISYDVNSFLSVIHSPEMQSLEYQVINMGSIWITDLYKQITSFPPIDCTNIPESIQRYSYPVIFFPAVSRKTIDTKFEGEIFNPHLIHHYVDHWMGFYVSRKHPGYNFTMGRNLYLKDNHTAWIPFRSTWPNPKWDNHDANTFCNLAAVVIQNQKELKYTSDI